MAEIKQIYTDFSVQHIKGNTNFTNYFVQCHCCLLISASCHITACITTRISTALDVMKKRLDLTDWSNGINFETYPNLL